MACASNSQGGDDKKLFEGIDLRPVKTWDVNGIAALVSKLGDNPIQIGDRNVIASYSFDKKSKNPKIVVPGAPKKFCKWSGNIGQDKNEGHSVRDQNLDAAFTAVRVMHPEFKVSDYNIAVSMSALECLYYITYQTVRKIRTNNELPDMPEAAKKYFEDDKNSKVKLRIDVRVIGKTVMMVQERKFQHGIGYGISYKRWCCVEPDKEMQREGKIYDGIYKWISKMQLGDLKMLLSHEVDAAQYPDPKTLPATADPINVPPSEELDVEVVVGGFKGNSTCLTQFLLASLGTPPRPPANTHVQSTHLHPGKWMTQYLCGSPDRYFGRQRGGRFNKPSLKSLDEIRHLCGLDASGKSTETPADLWIKVLKCVLGEIVQFAGECRPPLAKFVVISDADKDRLTIYGCETKAAGGKKFEVVSQKTLNYLESAL